jgi:hypothetical protein
MGRPASSSIDLNQTTRTGIRRAKSPRSNLALRLRLGERPVTLRRVSHHAGAPGEGLLTESVAGLPTGRQDLVLVPRSHH